MSSQGLLSKIIVKTPCRESWANMHGDEKSRFCARCRKNVHNLSAMTSEEAEALLHSNAKICIRMYRRPDGTVLTSECGPGKRRRLSLRALMLTLIGSALGVPYLTQGAAEDKEFLLGKIARESPSPTMGEPLMGDVAIAPTATPEVTPVVPEPEHLQRK